VLERRSWPRDPVFDWLQRAGASSLRRCTARSTVASAWSRSWRPSAAAAAVEFLRGAWETAQLIGEVRAGGVAVSSTNERRHAVQARHPHSGRGSNMMAIARACLAGSIAAQVAVVISDRADAGSLPAPPSWVSRPHGAAVRRPPAHGLRALAGGALDAHQPDVIALAGFMAYPVGGSSITTSAECSTSTPRSCLPTAACTLIARARGRRHAHGASVHFVTRADGGPVVLQSKVAVEPGDTEATLSARVQATEHIIYPRVLGWCGSGVSHGARARVA